MILQKLFLYLCLISVCSKCARIVEYQKDHPSKKYCEATKSCAPGSHIMCKYYKPELGMGPLCHGSLNMTMDPESKELIRDIINQVRSKMANGEETGKDDQKLPKAYGMKKLEWDEELEYFAQVWTNQCITRRDTCRATSKFENPGQVLNLIRFSNPDWNIITANPPYLDEKGFTKNKLRYAIETAVRTTYRQKSKITKDMLESYPDLNAFENLASIRGYMTMVHAGVTHIGCAMSTFHAYHATTLANRDVVYNSVQFVCNFSTEPKTGEEVITTLRNSDSSDKCGCPPGTEEDEECLCVTAEVTTKSSEKMEICENDPGCTPSLILLPIITVENAPPEKLYKSRINGSRRTDLTFKTKNMLKPLVLSSDDDFLDSEVLMPNTKNINAVDLLRRLNGN